MLRVGLFLLTNIAILIVLSIVLSLFGIHGTLDAQGVNLDLTSLLIISAVFGMGGSFISLMISKWIAKRMMGVRLIENHSTDNSERWLITTVKILAEKARIGMPEVGIFESSSPNAFATGASKNNALVAVSTGLLQQMDRGQVEAVLAHEVSHVANGDMITLSLIQGVVNTFVIFFSRIIGHLIDRIVFKVQRGHGLGYYIGSIVAQIILSILASMIVLWFSRRREFRADAGAAALTSPDKMISALKKFQAVHNPKPLPDEMQAFGIIGGFGGGMKKLFSSHPPIENRIAALEKYYD